MTDERDPRSGDGQNAANDGLEAWMAANFPPQKPEPAPESESTPAAAPPPPAPPPAYPPPPTWQENPPPANWPPPASPPPNLENPPPHDPVPALPFGERPADPPVVPPMAEELEGIPPATEFPPPPSEAFADVPGPSGLDALFGESKFVEYEDGISAAESPFARRSVADTKPVDGEERVGAGENSTQKILLWVAGSLIALLVLITLFVLGTKLPSLLGPAPEAVVAPVQTPTPSPTEVILGPVEPGEYVWDELLGGECVAPYDGAWETKYTVVDCETPHPAQLVTRGTFTPEQETAAYPGFEALQAQVNLLCTAPTVVDYGKANAYTDIQVDASFAVSSADWADGNRSYYCFLSRSGGGDLTGTIAMPQVAPTPEPSEAPAP